MSWLRFISVTFVTLIFLMGCQPPIKTPSHSPTEELTDDDGDPETTPYRRRPRRRGGGGGGGGGGTDPPPPPPPIDTSCPAENPDSSYKLTDITFEEAVAPEDESDSAILHIYVHPFYRYRRYENSRENFNPRDWGQSSPEQNILLKLHNPGDETIVWAALNKALIQYETGKAYFIYLDGTRFDLFLRHEYSSTNGITHIIFESRKMMLLTTFGDEVTVHLATGTENSCSYFQQN